MLISGINTSDSYTKEWYQQQAVLRVSFGNFLFFAIFALIMIGVKDQNDRRDSWHHGGWGLKMIVWFLLIVLMFFVPNVIVSFYGKFLAFLAPHDSPHTRLSHKVMFMLLVLVYELESGRWTICVIIYYAFV